MGFGSVAIIDLSYFVPLKKLHRFVGKNAAISEQHTPSSPHPIWHAGYGSEHCDNVKEKKRSKKYQESFPHEKSSKTVPNFAVLHIFSIDAIFRVFIYFAYFPWIPLNSSKKSVV
jgi:FAD/FMN-containing dehydrogenase